MFSEKTKTALMPNRKGGRIFYVRENPLLNWHVCDRALTAPDGQVMALHGAVVKPNETVWQLAELEKTGGIMCERCLEEFEQALPVLIERKWVKSPRAI